MKKNIGNLDKGLRVIIAITVALLYYFNVITGTLAYILMVVAIILLITSFINFCSIYSILGVNSVKSKK
ncbi:YgaP family membrane protein [Algibacter luteus]|uniref:Inner membrane protein YgaP-like transmembrane domain-containing protein n=1 Tax=Algibacter luteus TaxID=1178825 RepID=A0A1M6FY90_9FLAO|nr:DUF2892 domain-containing protein [Algibacter luteus]SHJ02663.1 Protein of unknown function [Algibacter luteus]